jgi:hypothetical protein
MRAFVSGAVAAFISVHSYSDCGFEKYLVDPTHFNILATSESENLDKQIMC